MTKKKFFKGSLYFTGIVTVGIWSLLVWNHYHGGVPSHHILQRGDLPAISNWWGGILLPLLTLFIAYRIEKRLIRNSNDDESNRLVFPIKHVYRFLFALSFGILLSLFITLDYSDLSGYMMYGLLLLALFYPIYRAECYLGFVIGMTYTIGAVLPTGVGIVLALIGAVLYLYVRTGIIFIVKYIVSLLSTNKHNTKK